MLVMQMKTFLYSDRVETKRHRETPATSFLKKSKLFIIPSFPEWLGMVNSALPLNKWIYHHRKSPKHLLRFGIGACTQNVI